MKINYRIKEVYVITISLCMIVKNESAVLRRCLESYKAIADEIIIVDTGSEDDTKKIAYEYTDKVYDYQWDDDFSHARNFAFEKASCDYIFSADADEVLDDVNRQKIMDLKAVMLPQIDIVQMKYVNCIDGNSVYNSKKELRPKLFKRVRTFEWISPIHETVRLEPVVYDSDAEILHMPETHHGKRDFNIFVKSLNKGVHFEKYVVTMFCKELWCMGDDEDYRELLSVFEKYMTAYTDADNFKEVSCVLARMYRKSDMKEKFFKVVLKQAADNPSSEICMELGDYYFASGDTEEAVLWYYNAAYETQPILDIHSGGDEPLVCLGRCYKKMSEQKHQEGFDDLAQTYREIGLNYESQAEEWVLPEEI